MIGEWFRRLRNSRAGGWALNALEFVRAYWPFVGAGMLLYISWVIINTTNELKGIKVNQKAVKLWNKKVETTAEDDSLVVNELRQLRENEVVIIYTYENEKVHVKRIPDDSLQFWADSLYNCTK
jgi:hypothetical protein